MIALRRKNAGFTTIYKVEFNNYKAKIIHNDKIYNASIRLKGDRYIHWNEENKSSYRINIRQNKRILGLKKFSLQKPRTRNYIYEWIFHELNSENGLIKFQKTKTPASLVS